MDVDRNYRNLVDTVDNASDALAVDSVRVAQAMMDAAVAVAVAAVVAAGPPAAVFLGRALAGRAADNGTGGRLTINLQSGGVFESIRILKSLNFWKINPKKSTKSIEVTKSNRKKTNLKRK